MNEQLRRYYLEQLDIAIWEPRVSNVDTREDEKQSCNLKDEGSKTAAWELLRARALACQACSLSKTRTHVVFGTGNTNAECLIVGEAPGFYEDQQAEPFVGRAGQLLNAMIGSIGHKREEVYIANVLKCRPPNNRDPQPSEVEQCTPFLVEQIQLISPKMIVALGRHAARFLLKTEETMKNLRGKAHYWGEKRIPVVVTYHPAYLLRNPLDKGKAFLDWLEAKKQLKCTHHV